MTYTYLDWNVFNRIEKKNDLNDEQLNQFSKIEGLIAGGKIICPYSNAHINDLLRGHRINPSYIPKHLETIKRLTNNLCIVQYWGNNHVTWHYRDIEEFFISALNENVATTKSFTELLDFDETGLWQKQLDIIRAIPVPENFKEIFKANPIFDFIFSRTKTNMNMLAICEDMYDFSNNAKKDYSLYKSLRTFANQSRTKLGNQKEMLKEIDNGMTELPKYLNNDEIWEKYAFKNRTSDNPAFQEITDTYFKIDFRGYKSDDKFSNMIDDSLHVFYGAHCDYFITLDDKCHYKATETYHKLGINTRAMKPNEFIHTFSS